MLAATSLSDLALSAPSNTLDPILELDGIDLVARIRDGSLRAEHVCVTFLEQCERYRWLNAITWINPSVVLARARELDQARDKGVRLPSLAGLPLLIKDNIDTVGFPTSAGTASLKGYFPRTNAPVAERLFQEGAILIGKSNMHELAMGTTSSNPTFGFVRNPYGPDLISGGSSGGSGAAIAARMVPAALGTDTAGSVRIPAALCGTVGFRPSTYPVGLYSKQGVVPHTPDLDTIGPMGRCVADVALLHTTIVRQQPVHFRSLERVRIGIPRLGFWDDLDPEVEQVTGRALERLRDGGVTFVDIDLREAKDAASQIVLALASRVVLELEHFLRTHVPSVSLRQFVDQVASREVRAAMERGMHTAPDPNWSKSRSVGRNALAETYRTVFRKHRIDAAVFPTVVMGAPPIRTDGDDPDELIQFNGRLVPKLWTLLRNTFPAAALGAPALSLPAGLTSKGLPIGLELDGLPGSDRDLLSLALAAEAALGRVRAPPLVLGS